MRNLVPAILLATATPALADDELTLRDAIRRATRANPTLQAAGADLVIARAQVTAAEGAEDLVLDATANVNVDRATRVAGQVVTPVETDRVDLTGGLTYALGTGGRIGLRAGDVYERTVTSVQLDPTMAPSEVESRRHSPSVALTLFQPLARGFGGSSPTRAAIRRARIERTAEERRRVQVASEVVRDVIIAYWELSYAQHDVEIRRSSLVLAKEQLRLTKARLDVGAGARTDLAAVRQGIAIREEDLVLAELALLDRALALRRLTGMDITPRKTLLVAADEARISDEDAAIDDVLEAAMGANPELGVLAARREQAELEVEVTENGLLPQLDLTASAGPIGYAERLGDAVDQLGGFDSYQLEAGVVLSVPLGNHGAKGAARAAKGALRKVKVTRDDVEAQVREAVTRAAMAQAAARRRVEVLAEATEAAELNLTAERARFEVGRSTNFDVLLRQEELAESQLRRARAIVDYLEAEAALQALTGDLLAVHDVRIEGAGGPKPDITRDDPPEGTTRETDDR